MEDEDRKRARATALDNSEGGVAATSLYLFGRLREAATQQAQQVETRLLRSLKSRLDAFDPPARRDPESRFPVPVRTRRAAGDIPGSDAGTLLRALLERSLEQHTDTAEETLALRVVEQLVPDEARILSALSDGVPTAACHIAAVKLINRTPLVVAENISRIGVDAGVMLGHRVPVYLGHMRALGLIEAGPEDSGLAERYTLLESELQVRHTTQRIEEEMGMRARILRFSLRISEFGQALWQAGETAHG